MLQIPACQHRRCKHLQGVKQSDGTERTEVPVCAAFPNGIPTAISYGNNLHLKPYKGDHGIQYERQDGPTQNVEGIKLSSNGIVRPFWIPEINENKAIHKRLYQRYGRYVVYLVNGEKVRDSSEQMEAFTDFATKGTGPSQLPQIPKDEIWVEDTLGPQERRIAITWALRYLTTGSYEKALTLAKREQEHALAKQHPLGDAHNVSGKLYKQGPLLTPLGNSIYLVDGGLVRQWYKIDFVLGGNGEAYKWIPEFELWIEQDVQPDERIYILIHELVEWWQMKVQGMAYGEAHDRAEQVEYKWRHSGGRPAVDAMTEKWVEQQVKGVG